jgi:DtxR family Mn-dependent transcriptional regulator
MVKRLARDGYVEVSRGRIAPTEQGRAYGEKIVRRHRLAELLLINVLGLDWSLAHEEAEKLEHVISDAVEARIIALLDGPTKCPHGNPIPGLHDGRPDPFERLAATAPGDRVILRRVTEEVEIDFPTMRYLDESHFIPGREATVISVAPDGSLMLDLDGSPMAIGGDLAQHLYVEQAAPVPGR